MKDLIRSKTNNSEDYDEKYKKVKFISDDDLPLKETLLVALNAKFWYSEDVNKSSI